ncbi:hypothetical protein FRC10_009189 [Ceratobasidium sp. 414]|nr:hypothetical protein FRC10_009189 [Ceratobasidium sp. 414]
MRPFSFIAASLISFATFAAGATVAPPQFTHLLTGTIITSPSENASFIQSPYGHRLTAAGYVGGNWTLPNGTLIANVYPNVGGDSGVQDNTGTLHVDTRMTWKLTDGHYLWMHALGQGVAYVSDDLYIEIETDSTKFGWLNNKYFIGVGTFSGAIWTINLFGVRKYTWASRSAPEVLWITTMTPMPSPAPSPPALPFAPAPTRVKFHLEDTIISRGPSPAPSTDGSDTDPVFSKFNEDTPSLVNEKLIPRSHLAARVDSADDAPGTLPDEYYDAAMAPWRAAIRRRLVKNLKYESEWLGSMQVPSLYPLCPFDNAHWSWQRKIRRPWLDTYFVYTSTLGTHTFFMIVLPTFFFFGYPMTGFGILYVLAAGVYFSSLIKDLICSPRPFEPTVTRLTVGTHHLEYGFPSTHSTNSVSIALYIYSLAAAGLANDSISTVTYHIIQVLLVVYAFSIVFGRLYCAMHSFTDCIAGIAVGTAIWAAQMQWGNTIDGWVTQNGWMVPVTVLATGLFVVHRHAEPVDDCPCFEDAIAFVSVVMGAMLARWHFARFTLAPSQFTEIRDYFVSRTPGASLSTQSDILTFLLYATLKMTVGIAAIFVWRIVAKRVCLAILPPIFRLFSRELGFLPTRRWYTPATDYSSVPADAAHLRTVPSVIDLPGKASVVKAGVLPRTHIYRVVDGAEAKQRPGKGVQEKQGLQMVDRQVAPSENGVREEKVKHYDADVLTKVVVYMGIGSIATGVIPVLFEKLGWGFDLDICLPTLPPRLPVMGKQGKSSASSATRKKHQRKANALDPSISIAPAAKSQGKGKGKKSKEPRVKQYIPPPKFKPLVEDPIDKLATTGLLAPNMVLCFRGLSKKDPVTKTKALEELTGMLGDDSWPAALPVWPGLRDELHAFLLSHSDAGTLLGAWTLGANDMVTPIATSLRSCWDSTILWRQEADTTDLLDIQDQLEDLVSSVIQALVEPDALYQRFAPLTATTKDGTDKADSLNAHEQPQDRDARIRISALGAVGWMLGTLVYSGLSDPQFNSMSPDTPPTVALPQLIPALTELLSSNPLVGSILCAQESPSFLPVQVIPNEGGITGPFGHGQRGVRVAAWGVVKTFVKYFQRKGSLPGEQAFETAFLSSLGTATLRSAWTEPDAGVRTSMWEPLLALVTTSPEIWSTPSTASLPSRDDDETSSSEDDANDAPPLHATEAVSTILPGQAAYIDLLNFLQLGCLGSGVQSYPAIVIVLSTLPPTVLPYDHDNLARFFDSFWAAYDGNALSALPRDRELVLKSFLSAFLECIVFACRKLKQTVVPATDSSSSTTATLLESIVKARIGQVMTELVHGGLAESLPIGISGTLLGESIKKLEQIAPDIVGRAWSSAWKSVLLDVQDQVPQGLKAAKLLASMLSPTAGSVVSEQSIKHLLVEIGHLESVGTRDVDASTRQGQVLRILWEHAKVSDTTWLAEVTGNALREGLMQHLISAVPTQDMGTLLNGFLGAPSVPMELRSSTWTELLRLIAHNSAFELLGDILGSVRFSPPQPVQQPELYQASASWAAEVTQGNNQHLRELSSVLDHWDVCISRPQFYGLLAILARSFIQEAEELVFAAEYSQITPALESTTQILLAALRHLDTQPPQDAEPFDLAYFGAFLYILPALSSHIPAEFGGYFSQFGPGRKQWLSLTTPNIHGDAEHKGRDVVARLLKDCNSPLRVSEVLDVANRSGLYVDEKALLAEALPPQTIFDSELEDLAENPSSLMAEVDPLVSPIDRDPTGSGLLHFDAQGFLKYPRITRALSIVLAQNRHLAKEQLWSFRHLLALQQLCLDFVSAPSWPSDAFKPGSLNAVQAVLDSVSQLVIYIGNSLFDDLGLDWHQQLVARLSPQTGDLSSPQNASDVVFQLYSLASRNSATLRDVRLLRRVMQMVLRDADPGILDAWAGFAQQVQNQQPSPAEAIGSIIASRGVESPRLDRWRNELASRLAGVPPSSANTTGIPLLRMLNSLAPPVESGIIHLPQQRAIYLVQALQKWMASDEDLDESLEAYATVTLYHLLPILQTVPGAHWEFAFDILENNLGVDGETSSNLYLLLQTLRAIYSINELASTNKALQEEWRLRREGVYESILGLFLTTTDNAQKSETQDKYHICLVDCLRALSTRRVKADLLDKLLSLTSSQDLPIKAMAHELARSAVAQITEQRVVEAAVATVTETEDGDLPADEQQFELPQSLIEKLAPISPRGPSSEDQLNLLLSWWIAVEFFDNSSLKVRQGYLEQLRRQDLVKLSLLPCLFELLSIGMVGAKPFGLSQWYVEEYYFDLYDASLPSALNVMAAHVYYKALKSIPGLIRSWWSDCQDKQLSSALSSYTKTYFSPVLVKQELSQFRSSAAAASEALNDDTFSVKVAPSVNEISAVYSVDDQTLEVAVRLPPEFPLKAAEVRDVRGISGMESRRRAWVFGVQQTAQQGLIYDALSVYKKNVAGHFEGKSECAICYS